MVPGSNHEPVYPDRERGSLIHAEGVFEDLDTVEKASDLGDGVNTLSRVAERYESSLPVVVDPGTWSFFIRIFCTARIRTEAGNVGAGHSSATIATPAPGSRGDTENSAMERPIISTSWRAATPTCALPGRNSALSADRCACPGSVHDMGPPKP